MRFGGRLAMCAVLWATAASSQPVIVDPPIAIPPALQIPPYELGVEAIVPSGLDQPGAMVFFGSSLTPEFLIVEKNTGRVRHFVEGVEQAQALDLAVDNCGDRGLIGIALHPSFDPTPTPVTDPPTTRPLDKDWAYLSYFTDEGRTDDGCDGDAVLRVARFVWDDDLGTLTLDPQTMTVPGREPGAADDFQPFAPFARSTASSTAVSGAIATNFELAVTAGNFAARLYIAIGSGERLNASADGQLQNVKLAAPLDTPVFDDTSVVLRLDESGGVPTDNPIQPPPPPPTPPVLPEYRYFSYGFRDARNLTFDPVFLGFPALWYTEHSDDDKPDEINTAFSSFLPLGTNGGYRDYQGRQAEVPPNIDKDTDELNPDYTLFDLVKVGGDDERFKDDPISTYLNPSFSFEDDTLDPTGLGFGGFEVGPQHRNALFVGMPDGRLFRFPVTPVRSSFALTAPLVDGVANLAVPGDPGADPPIPDKPEDDLSQILIGTGFGDISYVERARDGSIYVVDRAGGAVHRVFWNADRDLAAAGAKVTKKISLSAKKQSVTKSITVTLTNTGARQEQIFGTGPFEDPMVAVDDLGRKLTELLGLTIAPADGAAAPAGCVAPEANVVVPWYALPPYPALLGIAEAGTLKLEVAVTWACTPPFTPGVTPYDITLSLDSLAIGIKEDDQTPEEAANDLCPRDPILDDPLTADIDEAKPGCGAKGGGPLRTNLTLK